MGIVALTLLMLEIVERANSSWNCFYRHNQVTRRTSQAGFAKEEVQYMWLWVYIVDFYKSILFTQDE
jgi:hypothetical protein